MTDGIDRDLFLDYSAKSKIFNLPKHIQLLRCGPLESKPPDGRQDAVRRPAIRWSVSFSPRRSKDTDQGFVARFSALVVGGLGDEPELFECWSTGRSKVVETRRLELLTLSLQRRCSAS